MRLTSIPQFARNANRLREVILVLSKYGLADWISRLDLRFAKGLFRGQQGGRLAELTHETRIRLALTELGTTYIKLGQLLSTRPDLVGPELARELTALQAGTPPDPPEVVRATVEKELGKPIDELFAWFDEKALASASIGQVHEARLKDGAEVVVKVQRAGIAARIRNDLEILVALADLAEQYLPELRPYQPRATTSEFQRTLLHELDFGREMRYLEAFRLNFDGNRTVRFPRPFPRYSTARVLVMERLDGVKLSEGAALGDLGLDREELARRGAQVFLEMIFRHGFYHADPHPGNVVVLPGGVIGLLDCGMVGRLSDRLREDLAEGLVAVAANDPDRLTALLVRLCASPTGTDPAAFAADVAEFVSYYNGQPLDRLDLGTALNEVAGLIHRHQLVLPTQLALLLKVIVTLEGTSRLLSPQFRLTELLRPFQRRLIAQRYSPRRQWRRLRRLIDDWGQLGEMLPRTARDLLQRAQNGRLEVRVHHYRMTTAVNRLVFGITTSALFLGSALLWALKTPPLFHEVSVVGVLGCLASLALAARLLWAILRSGWLDAE